MVRAFKNPDITNAQRARLLRRRLIEERSIAEAIWQQTQPETDPERLTDYLHYREYEVERRRIQKKGRRGYVYMDRNIGVRAIDHIVTRLVCGILWPDGFNQGRYPLNEAEGNQDKLARHAIATLIVKIRSDERFAYIGIITDQLHEDPETHDLDNVIFDGRTEKQTPNVENVNRLQEDDPRSIWIQRRQRRTNTSQRITQMTIDNFLRSEAEARDLERQEENRRAARRGP